MGWKERYFAPTDRFTRIALLPAIILVTLPLALVTETDGRLGLAFVDLWRRGFGAARFAREDLVWALRVDLAWYIAFWLLAVAGAAASCITIEREEDTWVSLTSTPLTGWQILRGKLLGAIWNQRGFAAVLLGVWGLGLITGALHPIGVLASMVVVSLLTWLVAALGLYASLRSRSTARAIAATLTALGVLNGYPILLLWRFFGGLGWESSFSILGALPRLAVAPLVSYAFAGDMWTAVTTGAIRRQIDVTVGLTFVIIYVAIAAVLTRRIVREFDRWLDRPRVEEWLDADLTPVKPRKKAVEAALRV